MKILPSILLIAAAANVGTALAPRGKTRRTVLFAVALTTLLALLLPILSAMGEPPALPGELLPDNVREIGDTPARLVAGEAERALAQEIVRRFGAERATVSISLPAGENDPGSITVVLAARDAGLKDKIAAWLSCESHASVAVRIEGETE